MLTLSARFAAVILCFAPLFFQRSWQNAEVSLVGAKLAPGRRTVSYILRWFHCKVRSKSQMAAVGFGLGGDLEQLGHKGGLGPYVSSAYLVYLLLPEHRHRLVAYQRSSRRMETAGSVASLQCRPEQVQAAVWRNSGE